MLLDNVQVQIKMKKILSIIFVSLLLSASANADENKWKVGENYLTAKCFFNMDLFSKAMTV